MRILIIGGTEFIRSFIVKRLNDMGNEVALFNGEQTQALPAGVNRIEGKKENLSDFREEFKVFDPRIVVDIVPFTEGESGNLIRTFQGTVDRIVAVTSLDVYRACEVWAREDPGPIEPTPMTEESPLRQSRVGDEKPDQSHYEIMIEKAVLNESESPGTVLRIPRVYGPGSHNLFSYLKRMDDSRPAFLIEKGCDRWRWTRGYVENVADAIATAIIDRRAEGRTYNLGEPDALPQAEWVREIGQAAGWKGEILVVPTDVLPDHMRDKTNPEQDMFVDTKRIRKELGYNEMFSRKEALTRTIDWLRANPPERVDPWEFDYAAEDKIIDSLKQDGR